MYSTCLSPVQLALSYINPDAMGEACELILTVEASPQSLRLNYYVTLFALTCLLETPIYFYLLKQLRLKRLLIAVLILNFATHPIVIWILRDYFSDLGFTTRTYLLSAETIAIVTEALLLFLIFKIPYKRAWFAAITANLFSWWFGLYLVDAVIEYF